MYLKNLDFKDATVTWKITGHLQQSDLETAQKFASDIIRKQGSIRILVIAEDFKGWAKTGDWGDLSFQLENDQYIKKVAVVVDKKWEDMVNMFIGKGLREFPVECFQPSEKNDAMAWLEL